MFVPTIQSVWNDGQSYIERHRNSYNSPYTLKVMPKSTRIRIMGHNAHGGDEKSIPSQLTPVVMVPDRRLFGIPDRTP
jgi:hypothetical protein